jgi:hypothetical protein
MRLRARRERRERRDEWRRAQSGRARRPVQPRRHAMPQPSNFSPDVWDEGRRDMLLLEFCENGDLETLLYR